VSAVLWLCPIFLESLGNLARVFWATSPSMSGNFIRTFGQVDSLLLAGLLIIWVKQFKIIGRLHNLGKKVPKPVQKLHDFLCFSAQNALFLWYDGRFL